MKSLLLTIALFFSVIISAQKTSSQEVEKNRIAANIYAILIDGKSNFENFKGNFISNDNKDVTIFSAKNQNDATNNFFATKIKYDKSLYNMFLFESDDTRGELFFQTAQLAFEKLVNEDRLTKKELKFTIGQIETKGTTYYNIDGISPVAYIWLNSTSPALLYSIAICANENTSKWVQDYVTINKISIPKPLNSIAKTTSKPVKKESNIAHQDLKNYVLEPSGIEGIDFEKLKPQFPTSHLQPNYVADQQDWSTLDEKDIVRRQNGYEKYLELGLEARNVADGYGDPKEVNYEKAFALANEAIRIFPNLSDAYIVRGKIHLKSGNKEAAIDDFEKAKQLAPFTTRGMDKLIATAEGKEYIDPVKVNNSYEYRAPVSLYNSTNSESQNNTQSNKSAKCICCMGTGQKEIKGMYLGLKTYSVTPLNGLGISHNETVAQYGPSRYVPCDCCR
jgi:tetratricopeptide (TPR) repeat protein